MPPPTDTTRLQADLERLETQVYAPVYTHDALIAKLEAIYDQVATAKFTDYDFGGLKSAAPDIVYQLFDYRIALRDSAEVWRERGIFSRVAAGKLRDCMRIMRYVGDFLGEIAAGHPRSKEGDVPRLGFTGGGLSTLINWKFYNGQDIAFRPGDVVVVRGHAHNSAAIARIGDVDSQFSHVGMVYAGNAGQHWMVESLIEDGAIVNPLSHSIGHGIARAALYRYRDAELAAKAAQLIHDYVAATRKPFVRRILYDFSMRLDKRRRLFCAKLVRLAFEMASSGRIVLPAYPTHIGMKNRDFLDRIGVKADDTFAPADMDVEPGFDLVAEWQDYRETSNVRLQDFTMDKLFEWMDDPRYNYRFKETPFVWIVSLFGRLAAHLSDDAKEFLSSVVPRVPINMRRKTVAAVAMLHKTAEPIYHELQAMERANIAKTGRPLIGEEIYAALEGIRAREGDGIGYLVRTTS